VAPSLPARRLAFLHAWNSLKFFQMSVNIQFRPGVIGDARAFGKLDAMCFPRGVAFSQSTFSYYLQDPFSVSIVAESSRKVIGFSVGEIHRGGEANIVTVDVHPDFRRCGIGNELLSRLEARLVEKGASLFFLQVAVDNDAALTLYKNAGYRISSLLPRYYQHPGKSRSRDAYLMMKPAKSINRG
jgi:ribosomal-protein-alanine N-acetyltransferase